MVRTSISLSLVVVGALVASGCIQRTPVVRLDNATPVLVAFVHDPEGAGGAHDVPEPLKSAVTEELGRRNLQAEVVPFAQVEEAFSRLRASPRRFEVLSQQPSEAPLLLLVETRATFFSQMQGRYRWQVGARLTGHTRGASGDPTVRSVEDAVTLLFDHERAPEALREAAPRIAAATGTLFDDLLATPPPAKEVPGSDPNAPPGGPAPAVPAPLQPGPGGGATGLRLPGKGAIYFVMVDRFANGDPSNDGDVDPKDPQAFHGGDLKGLIARLDELKALGVETVWLSPVFKMRTEKFHGHGAFHGYWVEDLFEVEPRFGDAALLRRLSDELHAREMKLLLDMVLNHVGPDTRLVTEKPHWFNRKGPLTDWKDPVQLERHDVHGLPDLNVDDDEVYRHLLAASEKWIREVRPDGFRLDAVKHLPASFWRRYTADLKRIAGADFLLLGEMLDGDPKVIAKTWREGTFDALFDFPLHFAVNDVICGGAAPTKLGAVLSADRTYPDASRLVTLPDNHDLPRLLHTCGGDEGKAMGALLFTLTARGTPSLTWGTESAHDGKGEPENRASMRFDDQPLRPFISQVLGARALSPALREGVPFIVDVGPEHFVMARITEEDVALITVQRSAGPLRVKLPPPLDAIGLRDLFGNVRPIGETPLHGGVSVKLGRAKDAQTRAGLKSLRETALASWKGTASPRQVSFEVSGVPLGAKDVLHVIGSAPELGSWDAGRAPAVSRDGKLLATLPAGAVTEFKLLVRRDGELKWESGDNRALVVTEGADPLVVPLQWRAAP